MQSVGHAEETSCPITGFERFLNRYTNHKCHYSYRQILSVGKNLNTFVWEDWYCHFSRHFKCFLSLPLFQHEYVL